MDKSAISTLLKNLSLMRGDGTTLVSLLIPAGSQLSLSRQHILREMGEASNIKSRQTRQAVQQALRSVKSALDTLAASKTHGYSIYAGLVTHRGGREAFV